MKAALSPNLLSFDCPELVHRPRFMIYFAVPDARGHWGYFSNTADDDVMFDSPVDLPSFVLYGIRSGYYDWEKKFAES